MRQLLVATNNRGKALEFREILAGLPFSLTTLAEQGITVEIEETGSTFEENAVIKAEGYARLSGLLTLADDSGLEVDAMGGEPGVRSARYAGDGATDADRYRLLLERMAGVSPEKRGARFRCVIAIAQPGGPTNVVEGEVEGCLMYEPRGSGGFGYDPIFFLSSHNLTMAELPAEEKNRISHRAIAGKAARELLARLYGQNE